MRTSCAVTPRTSLWTRRRSYTTLVPPPLIPTALGAPNAANAANATGGSTAGSAGILGAGLGMDPPPDSWSHASVGALAARLLLLPLLLHCSV